MVDMDNKKVFLLVAVVAVVAIAGLLFSLNSNPSGQAIRDSYDGGEIPAGVDTDFRGYECDFTGSIVPFNQGLLNYEIGSTASNPETENKVTMGRRFSMVDKDLASQYVVLNDVGSNEMIDVAFSMLEYYECLIPEWLYETLEGLYLVKYQDEHVARASVMVLETREDAIYVAQMLLALSTEEMERKWITDDNGNRHYVAYTAQKAYWWTHDNMIIRIASHTTPMKANKTGIVQESSADFSVCETLDIVDEMALAKCIQDQFWREVPTDLLNVYLNKLPSDGDEVPEPEPGQFSNMPTEDSWPDESVFQERQLGCDPSKKEDMMEAFQMFDNFDAEKKREKVMSRLEDNVKVISVSTDKRWYYLGEEVTFYATTISETEDFGVVINKVKNDIFPNPEDTSIAMQVVECGDRESFIDQKTGGDLPDRDVITELPDRKVPTKDEEDTGGFGSWFKSWF